ncbi:unnamed protein product [Effrenium voratum]|nr:unnamed protein product [Effrenium voratum]
MADVMLFRATAPIRAGEEVLDRYSTPLADQFEYTLHTLAAHGMRDPLYEAAAARWETPGNSSNKLSEKRAQLMDSLTKIQRKVTYSRNEFHSVVQPDYEEPPRPLRRREGGGLGAGAVPGAPGDSLPQPPVRLELQVRGPLRLLGLPRGAGAAHQSCAAPALCGGEALGRALRAL